MIKIVETKEYENWLRKLRDRKARSRILIRVRRLSVGNAGDARPAGGGISELRIDHGPGYRVYYRFIGERTVLLLLGGDKSGQRQDIRKARRLARKSEEGERR